MAKNVAYWIEMSDYDLETAKAMLITGRYLYIGFMCHQTISIPIIRKNRIGCGIF